MSDKFFGFVFVGSAFFYRPACFYAGLYNHAASIEHIVEELREIKRRM